MGCGSCGLGLFRGLQITCQLTALGTWTSIEGITSVIPSTCTGHSWHSYRLLFGRFTQSQGTSPVGPATIAARAWPAFSMLPSAWHMNCSYSYSIEAPKKKHFGGRHVNSKSIKPSWSVQGDGGPPISTWSTWIFATTQGVTLAALTSNIRRISSCSKSMGFWGHPPENFVRHGKLTIHRCHRSFSQPQDVSSPKANHFPRPRRPMSSRLWWLSSSQRPAGWSFFGYTSYTYVVWFICLYIHILYIDIYIYIYVCVWPLFPNNYALFSVRTCAFQLMHN